MQPPEFGVRPSSGTFQWSCGVWGGGGFCCSVPQWGLGSGEERRNTHRNTHTHTVTEERTHRNAPKVPNIRKRSLKQGVLDTLPFEFRSKFQVADRQRTLSKTRGFKTPLPSKDEF